MAHKREQRGVSTLTSVVSITLLLAAIGLLLFQSLCACGGGGRKSTAISYLKQLALAHAMYLDDWEGYGPSPDTWMDQLKPYHKSDALYQSTHESRNEGEFGCAYFRPLGDLKPRAVENKAEVPLLFESSDTRWNANGDLSLLPNPPRWDEKVNIIAFLDTHVKAFKHPPKFEIKMSEGK